MVVQLQTNLVFLVKPIALKENEHAEEKTYLDSAECTGSLDSRLEVDIADKLLERAFLQEWR